MKNLMEVLTAGTPFAWSPVIPVSAEICGYLVGVNGSAELCKDRFAVEKYIKLQLPKMDDEHMFLVVPDVDGVIMRICTPYDCEYKSVIQAFNERQPYIYDIQNEQLIHMPKVQTSGTLYQQSTYTNILSRKILGGEFEIEGTQVQVTI